MTVLKHPDGNLVKLRDPYVGWGSLGARASAQIDREEADTLNTLHEAERYALLQQSARLWERQADFVEKIEKAALWLYAAAEAALPFLADHVALTLSEGPADRIAHDRLERALKLARGES